VSGGRHSSENGTFEPGFSTSGRLSNVARTTAGAVLRKFEASGYLEVSYRRIPSEQLTPQKSLSAVCSSFASVRSAISPSRQSATIIQSRYPSFVAKPK
jgi:hypothetical protein